MGKTETAIKGSVVGISSQAVSILTKFIVRTLFIRILGEEVLGLNSVLIDTISMLSLAEMGITSAMLYRLYRPIAAKDEKRINEWMAVYRLVYRCIAFIVGVVGFVMGFFLKSIVKDISLSWTFIYLAYYLQLIGSVSSYLLAHQRVLLNAYQKRHICIIVDMACNIIFCIIKAAALLIFKSYHIYLIANVLNIVVSNLVLYLYAQKKYTYLKEKVKTKREDFADLFADTKQVLANKLAEFMYSSTDNLIISAFLGTGLVGALSNYKYITAVLKSIVISMMVMMQAIIGNYLNADVEKEKSFVTLQRYTFVRFVIAGAMIVPFILLSDTFVLVWTGKEEYVMSRIITVALALEFYIGCLLGPLGEYILAMGKFKEGKVATFAGAITNLVLSLIGVVTMGIPGVLIATVISQTVIWAFDYFVIVCGYYKEIDDGKKRYIKNNLLFLIDVVISVIAAGAIITVIGISNGILAFIAGGIIAEIVFAISTTVIFIKTDEFKYAVEIALKMKNKFIKSR